MAEEQRQVARQTARIASIRDLSTGQYVKQEGWEPNYLLTKNGEHISRVNILGVVVTVPENSESLFIDDGSGKIEIRTFQEGNIFRDVTIGDIVLIIGRPRMYNNQIYINAEIAKKIANKGWLEYRKKEITLKNISGSSTAIISSPSNELPEPMPKEEIDEIDETLLRIKEFDKGNGCDVGELVKAFPKSEIIVEQLLLKGEIFEISPGRVKILE